MITTTNLSLKKAELTDNADLEIFINDNMDILDSEIISKIQNAGNTISIQAGTIASRPAFGTDGRIYITTDEGKIYRDNGSAWNIIGGTDNIDWSNIINKPDPTITLGGDLSGSVTLIDLGSGTLTATVADDSHNHIISNVDGLQTALDGKLASGSTAVNSGKLDNLDSTQFLRSDVSDTTTGQLTANNGFKTGNFEIKHNSDSDSLEFNYIG